MKLHFQNLIFWWKYLLPPSPWYFNNNVHNYYMIISLWSKISLNFFRSKKIIMKFRKIFDHYIDAFFLKISISHIFRAIFVCLFVVGTCDHFLAGRARKIKDQLLWKHQLFLLRQNDPTKFEPAAHSVETVFKGYCNPRNTPIGGDLNRNYSDYTNYSSNKKHSTGKRFTWKTCVSVSRFLFGLCRGFWALST